MAFGDIYRGKRVLVTGHTGFKGSWISEWLLQLGADVAGVALPPETTPNLFHQLGLERRVRHVIGDIRDLATVRKVYAEVRPEFVFHLAAQPLVRLSYVQPAETFATNVMGTVHVLEAARLQSQACAMVAVTTDKCYENCETGKPYREEDALGGHDPYSSSKGAAEIVISAYRRSFFSASDSLVRLASARAGNVIGGGDWALDRIVPDSMRALQLGQPIHVRNKGSTRPWQHVLEPLSGYLWLGACLANPQLGPAGGKGSVDGAALASAFNFGPRPESTRTVGELVGEILSHWPGQWEDRGAPNVVHEANRLSLSIEKASRLLGWEPVWNFSQAVAATVEWYRTVAAKPTEASRLLQAEIAAYTTAAAKQKLSWSR